MKSCLLDTNILLRLVQPMSALHPLVQNAAQKLWEEGHRLCYTSQNLDEFWNVCTRPAEQNGLGLSVDATDGLARIIELRLTLLPDNPRVHEEWRRLGTSYRISGVKVHDARLVASMRVHQVQRLLTMNAADFKRYEEISVLEPGEVMNK